MIKHSWENAQTPDKVVVLGAKGFVGRHVVARFQQDDIPVTALSSSDVDLTSPNSVDKLVSHLTAESVLVFISAKVPAKTPDLVCENLQMVKHVCEALSHQPAAHLINISTDAVYPDGEDTITENTLAAADNLHGACHLTRELMLKAVHKGPFVSIRPSLLYGVGDPHNGYGPNRFRRLANSGEDITLFGGGEETRDHVLITDLAELVYRSVVHRSAGVLNAATGQSHSFNAAAKLAVSLAKSQSKVLETPRQNPITHRQFDITNCQKAFPDFSYTPLEQGMALVQEQRNEGVAD